MNFDWQWYFPNVSFTVELVAQHFDNKEIIR